ncbi:MAG TPA: hypothetical protein VII06_16240 [Chloroflexota bacterium]
MKPDEAAHARHLAPALSALRGPWQERAEGWRRPALRIPALTWSHALVATQLLIIVAWTLVITRPFQNMDPSVVPTGREYLSIIQYHSLWTHMQHCGWCALWNGDSQGGMPAIPDPFGSELHPLVMLGTLGWGISNGAKLALVGGFLMAGLAQWWLGRVLRLGAVACVWSACMAVAGGHLSGRMDLGALVGVLSTAACALILPPLILLIRTSSRRAAVLLGTTLALAAVAGQGYMQAGFVLTSPTLLLLLPRDRARLRLLAKRFALAAGIAILLAAPFLVPFLHLASVWTKDNDPIWGAVQPFSYIALNLLIDDPKFLNSDALGKVPYPGLNVIFLGWLPVLLALWGLHKLWSRGDRQLAAYLAALIVACFWVASAVPLKWVSANIPPLAEQVTRLRFATIIDGLAIAPILALAAIGVDELLRVDGPKLVLAVATTSARRPLFSLVLRPQWLLLPLLLVPLNDAKHLGSLWITVAQVAPYVAPVEAALHTPDVQWVDTPFGEHYWVEPAVSQGLKLARGFRHYRLRERAMPEAVLTAGQGGPPEGMTRQTTVAGYDIYAAPGREYAVISHPDGSPTVCAATGEGGQLDVACDTPQAGVLTVKEHRMDGWQARVDGDGAALEPGEWLTINVPAGQHVIRLRYQPWDVPLGLVLGLLGVVLAVGAWLGRLPRWVRLPRSPVAR